MIVHVDLNFSRIRTLTIDQLSQIEKLVNAKLPDSEKINRVLCVFSSLTPDELADACPTNTKALYHSICRELSGIERALPYKHEYLETRTGAVKLNLSPEAILSPFKAGFRNLRDNSTRGVKRAVIACIEAWRDSRLIKPIWQPVDARILPLIDTGSIRWRQALEAYKWMQIAAEYAPNERAGG